MHKSLQLRTHDLVKIGFCSLCLLILYLPVFRSQVNDWINLPEYSHGFLFPPISLYLAWMGNRALGNTPASPNNFGLVVIVVGLFLFLMGNLAGESFTKSISFLVVLAGIILFLKGWQHLKAYSFAIALLIFTIPLPSIFMTKITFPMQLLASRVAEQSLHLIGIPVLREGNIIHLVGETLEVAEACSGIRSMLSLLAVGTVLAYFTTRKNWQRVVMILSCFPIAIFTNAFRVSMTGVLAHYYGMKAAEGFFHGFSGAVLYFAGLIMVGGVGILLNKVRSET